MPDALNPVDSAGEGTIEHYGEVVPAKAYDFTGRFREIISDPLNILIDRHPMAGVIDGDGRVTLHNGLKVPIRGPGAYYGNFSDILALNRGVHEPLEEYVFQQMLRRLPDAPSMLELGSYWSHYSMWLKLQRPLSSTICVEPDLSALEVGRSNFSANGFKGEFINAFVGQGSFSVDEFLLDRKYNRLSILHSDIQGFEVEMIDGAARFLSEHLIDYVFISTHDNSLHGKVVSSLEKSGYRVEISSDFEFQSTSFDGFVFASSPNITPLVPNLTPLGRNEIATSDPDLLIKRLYSWSGVFR